MTVAEAAKLMGLKASSVYALCASGQLSHYRYQIRGSGRGKIVIEPWQVDEYRARCLVTPQPVGQGVAAPVPLPPIRSSWREEMAKTDQQMREHKRRRA
jgi:excisionase family DNA binding protein